MMTNAFLSRRGILLALIPLFSLSVGGFAQEDLVARLRERAKFRQADLMYPSDNRRVRDRIASLRERVGNDSSPRRPAAAFDSQAPLAKKPDTGSGSGKSLEEGANCLFVGHSFFIPVARSFDALATKSDFTFHQSDFVFFPGPKGSPSGLWENENFRRRIETKLATGSIQLFGMTVAGRPNGAALEDYRRWIDLALKYNPDMTFFIGQYWLPGGPNAESEKYEALNQGAGQRNFEAVKSLRETYPNNQIFFVNYGLISSEMKTAFEAGNLPDVENLTGLGPKSLYREAIMGHGGLSCTSCVH